MNLKQHLWIALVAIVLPGATTTVKAGDGLDRTAMEIVADMSPGINLGNTLEATTSWTGAALWNNKAGLASETGWQGTRTSQAVIDYMASLGFRSVRIPCAWAFGHIANASTCEIDAQWMARVKEIVDYCIGRGLYVVLNDHWDGGWIEEHIADTDANTIAGNKARLTKLWTQIATEFRDYDEHLLLAGLNEPNAGDQAATNNLVEYNQTFVDAVRATGGNNERRVLVVQGPSTNIDNTCNFMAGKMPTDVAEGKLAVEVHYYNPWQFWGMEKDESWGKVFYYWGNGNHHSGSQHNATWGEESEMRSQLMKMKTNFVDKGYPVVIGEFGANWRNLAGQSGESQEKHDASIRAHYRELYSLCREMGGMVAMAWDVNSPNQNGTRGTMTLIDRSKLTVFGVPAMQGINDVYPRPDAAAIRVTSHSEAAEEPSAEWFTLSGQRLSGSPESRGIYVKKGRKVIRY